MLNRVVIGVLFGLMLPVLCVAQGEVDTADEDLPGISRYLPHNPAACAEGGIGNGGYDLVSYRQDGGPRFGSAAFPFEHGGLTYLFETEETRAAFASDPEHYLPAYSGWCAVTLALGRLSCPDYDNFKIEDDRLLLFELAGFTNGRTLWNSKPVHYRDLADDNYSIVLGGE